MSALGAAPAAAVVPSARALPGLLPARNVGEHDAFVALYGPRPRGGEQLVDVVQASGLTGRGGAGFPTARKLRAVRGRSAPVVVANGTEGEPASHKDKALMRRNPHLVIDGALLAAETVGARRVIVATGDGGARASLQRALESRQERDLVELVSVPERFVAGEESALVHFLDGGEAKPTLTPPRPFERGVDRRPTLVQNVETLASLALIARHGPEWFRSVGTAAEPGYVLATVGGAVRAPGVLEVPLGAPLSELLMRCGGLTQPAQAYLVGGYFGCWVAADDELRLASESLRARGGTLGARTVLALGEGSCGVLETARVVGYMAGQSAGQCGPCLFGLRALAQGLETIARAAPGADDAFGGLDRLHRQIARRGACAHPDGVLGFLASATRVFADEFAAHLAGHCSARDREPVLPTGAP